MNSYNKTTWVNGAPPALNAAHLNKIEDALAEVIDLANGNHVDLDKKMEYVTSATVDNATETGKVYYTTTDKALIIPVSGEFSQAQFRLARDGKIYSRRRSRSSTSVDFPAWGSFADISAGVDPEIIRQIVEDYIAEHGVDLTGVERTENRVTAITAQSDDETYPTAGAVRRVYQSLNEADANIRSSIGSLESGKANKSETYTKTQVDTALSGKANTSDIPDISGKADKATTLAGYGITDAYKKIDINQMFNQVDADLQGKADALDTYTKTQTDTLLNAKESTANKVTAVDSSATDTQYPSARAVYQIASTVANNCEVKANKVTAIGSGSTDTQYPSAKTVYNELSGKANAATTLSGYGITDAYTKSYIDQKLLELGGANVVNSVSEMVDTSRLYVLAETGHIWRYATVSSDPPNEINVKYYNKRISGSSGIDGVAADGCFINERIPVDLTVDSCIITMKNFASNMGTIGSPAYGNSKIVAIDESNVILGSMYIASIGNANCWGCPVSGNDCVGDAVEFAEQLITQSIISNASQIKYLVISPQIASAQISASDIEGLGIYLSTHGGTTTAWVDTGITYGGGNEEALTSLDARMTAAENNIAELAAQDSSAVVIPSYWQTEVDDTISKISALQDENGSKLLCFGWCSDMHIPANGTLYEKNIGSVAARVMKACNIPLFLMTGDMLSADSGMEISEMPTAYKKAWEYLSPIGRDSIIAVKGNHDAWTGTDGSGNYYIKGLSPEKLYNQLFAPQAEDIKREFGEDGSYFFIDYKPQKTRFVCLNSHWAVYEENQDGTAKYSTQKAAGLGQAQLDWLAQTALNVPGGYSVVIALHVPLSDALADGRQYVTNASSRDLNILRGIISAYCNKTTYSGSYTHSTKGAYLQEGSWADVNISCNFGSYNGTLLGLFCGHSHYDQFVTNDLPVPVVCITSAVNTPYDTAASVRVLGTKDETAFDFVCINRSTGAINLVRCGYGNDRVIAPN